MNWERVEKEYPNVYKTLDVYSCFDGTVRYKVTDYEIDDRDLYTFLDEQGIYVKIEPYLGGGDVAFYGSIIYRNEDFIDLFWEDESYFNTRAVCEESAFEQAFKILEEKLS